MLSVKLITCFIAIASLNFQPVTQPVQDDRTRDVWLESRSKSEPKPKVKSPKTPATKAVTPVAPQSAALGLGYTLFLVNKSGEVMRANPSRLFAAGDRIRLLVESNRDGFIYIFSQENDDAPKLLFPNTEVRGGNNLVRAHQTFWLPEEGDIEFDARPAKERLVVVFSQGQIPNLAASTKPEGVPVEASIFQDYTLETVVMRGGRLEEGKLLTKDEGHRGVRLNSNNPSPAVILLNQDQAQSRIVAKIELTHR